MINLFLFFEQILLCFYLAVKSIQPLFSKSESTAEKNLSVKFSLAPFRFMTHTFRGAIAFGH